jgi:hypothetical protein
VKPRDKRIDRLLIGTVHLPCSDLVVMSPATAYLWHQSGVNYQFYGTVDNITLNSKHEAQRVSKNLEKKMWKIELEFKIHVVDLSVFSFTFEGKNYV